MALVKQLYPEALYPRHGVKKTTTKWDTHGGVFKTQAKATVSFQLPDLEHTKNITYAMHVYDTNNSRRYDMIMG